MTQQNLSTSPSNRFYKSERLLVLIFLLSLLLVNPWIRGDGVGYYAFARALLIQHNLDFSKDYQSANAGFREARLDEFGQPKSDFRTVTGHLENHFTVGPAILWSPFLLTAHVGVLLSRAVGSSVAADGYSAPYRIAMALATAFYGFLGLLLGFRLAREYIEEPWALIATIAVWWASSLPVYMYFNPSWSHAHSAFAVALFLWYWHKTHTSRSIPQWLLLAAIAGLMLNIYYPNAMVLVVVGVEVLPQYLAALRHGPTARPSSTPHLQELVVRHLLFVTVTLVCLLPTFVTRYILYGSAFESGYVPLRYWLWRSPVLLSVLFSSNHGLFSWTPVILPAVAGLFIFWRRESRIGAAFLATFLAFYLFISCYPDWSGISSYGNRFFVSLTALFILGLGTFLDRLAQISRSPKMALTTTLLGLAIFVLWNAGLMFQWGLHLVPARGPVSFSEVVHNQFFAVPQQLTTELRAYLFHRKALMNKIESLDLKQLEDNRARQ